MYSPQFTTFLLQGSSLQRVLCVDMTVFTQYLSASHTCLGSSTDVTLHAPKASFGRQRLDHTALDLNFFASLLNLTFYLVQMSKCMHANMLKTAVVLHDCARHNE